ncbi:hypothetical protein BEL04_21240 [Mucilaginibacter sp. PPCGB 2223]|uniref:glycosyltransferase n=1 Tax=Mucilaginibacter sp. PPCGB 2223 TaxID=1886027 RepID=UPI0008253731|nr:glycosyltransferase [Mucilaginibacter sp. PPCGB 2223]OCX51228.1 hypothetical protein BEL04_21240 [Mucilaginibacter sp. PPCGB 2223]
MISIIISSAKTKLLSLVSENIKNTIGVEHEIIAFDNSAGAKGIAEIYNLGIRQAQYDLLCFMHEDIELLTPDWGVIVNNIFAQNPEVGLIGVAGSSYKPLTPSGWNGIGNEEYYTNLKQSYKFSDKPPELKYHNLTDQKLVQVACIDGVWMCTTREIALRHLFDESFTGFHVYDIDLSLNIGLSYRVAVTFEVLLDHFSEGSYNADWLNDTIKLHKKWEPVLPVSITNKSVTEMISIERRTFKYFISQLIRFKFPLSIALDMLNLNNRYRKLSTGLYLKLRYYILTGKVK